MANRDDRNYRGQRGESRGGQRGRGPAGPRSGGGARKPRSKVSAARRTALDACTLVRERDAFAHNVLEALFVDRTLSPEDRAFCTRLTMGVVQTYGTLDEVIDHVLDNPDDISANVRDCLRISAYEILFLGKDAYAAVDQGVELVRSIVPRAAGLANAVLRRVVKIADEFPFGDPQADLSAFARQQGFPLWLVQQFLKDLGDERGRAAAIASNDQAPVFVAANALRATDREVFDLMASAHGKPSVVRFGQEEPLPGCFRLEDGHAITDGRVKRAFSQGKILVSDAASQAVANLTVQTAAEVAQRCNLGDAPVSMLEVGAGRATKTILLQSNAQRILGRQLDLTTIDNQNFKTGLVRSRTQTYGVDVTKAITGDATKLDREVGQRTFDVIFIDAPCSGLGTLRRHPEIRWRANPQVITEASNIQLKMLKSAAPHVRVGGALVYATCTVAQEENQLNVKRFLESPEGAGFKLQSIDGKAALATRLGPGSCDAHFAVRMIRVE
ncbi:MAG: transcription antitermination factor NusB [Coriobacteriia bacterium]|nr:transcription antitermination factor NusB [Coriobacteriia bacterium]